MEPRIRKISIAKGYLTDDVMNYVVGNTAYKDFKIALIEKTSKESYIIKIKNSEDELVYWKELNSNVPVTIEYSLDYEHDITV